VSVDLFFARVWHPAAEVLTHQRDAGLMKLEGEPKVLDEMLGVCGRRHICTVQHSRRAGE
jgi:hypothetical protein